MNIAKRMVLVAIILALMASASAFAVPAGFKTADKKPSGNIEAIVIEETANFYASAGTVTKVNKGEKLTLSGMQDKNFARVIYKGEKGYMPVKAIMSLTGISAYVSKDCYAYEYGGKRKAKLVWGKKVYMVGRYTDEDNELWILCTNSSGSALAYIKKDNLYK